MRKYVAVYTPKNSDINEEITDIIETEDRDDWPGYSHINGDYL